MGDDCPDPALLLLGKLFDIFAELLELRLEHAGHQNALFLDLLVQFLVAAAVGRSQHPGVDTRVHVDVILPVHDRVGQQIDDGVGFLEEVDLHEFRTMVVLVAEFADLFSHRPQELGVLKFAFHGLETHLFVLVPEKSKLKQLGSFWAFVLVLRQASRDELLHFRAYLCPLAFAQEERRLLHFFLNLPLVLAEEVEVVEEQLVSDDAQRPNINFRCIILPVVYLGSHEGIGPQYFIETLLLR